MRKGKGVRAGGEVGGMAAAASAEDKGVVEGKGEARDIVVLVSGVVLRWFGWLGVMRWFAGCWEEVSLIVVEEVWLGSDEVVTQCGFQAIERIGMGGRGDIYI